MRLLPPLTALSLVLLMHAAAWQGVAGSGGAARSDLVVHAVQVRTIEAPAPVVVAAAPPTPAPDRARHPRNARDPTA